MRRKWPGGRDHHDLDGEAEESLGLSESTTASENVATKRYQEEYLADRAGTPTNTADLKTLPASVIDEQ